MTDYKEWTEELETQLKYIGECAQGYFRMYKMDILYYTAQQQKWSMLAMSSSILSGALLTLSLGLGINNDKGMIITSALLSFGTTLSQNHIRQTDYATLIADLKRQASKYSGLQNNIKRQLSLPVGMREKAKDYHYWISTNYDSLGETALNIRSETIEKYKIVCKNEGIVFPDENGDESKVVVHIDKTPPPVSQNVIVSPTPHTANEYTDHIMKYELARLANQD